MKRLHRILLILVVLMAAAPVAYWWLSVPPRLEAGRLIRTPGEYRSPDGKNLVRIGPEIDDGLTIEVIHQRPNGHATDSYPKPFPADSDWFLCWDSQSRLWSYIPQFGLDCWYADRQAAGITHVGVHGGWQGIPESFYEQLPATMKDVHRKYLEQENPSRRQQGT